MTTATAITIGRDRHPDRAVRFLLSGSETALTAASRPRIHHLARAGDRRARAVTRLTEDRERLIGAILLGNNAVNILASALATSVLISLVGDAGVAYATVGMTVVILIFAEVLPKTYAIRDADRAALRVAPLLGPVVWLLSPMVAAVRLIVSAALRALGAPRRSRAADAAQEELRGAIALHAQEGAVVKHERDMLDSILDLEEVEVGSVMTHRKKHGNDRRRRAAGRDPRPGGPQPPYAAPGLAERAGQHRRRPSRQGSAARGARPISTISTGST